MDDGVAISPDIDDLYLCMDCLLYTSDAADEL